MVSGEKTLLVTRPTRLIALRFYSVMALALIIAAILFFNVIERFASVPNPAVGSVTLSTILAGFFVLLAILAFLGAEIRRKTTRYIITDNKIIREDGILNKNTEMIPFTQLNRVDLHQTFSQRILKIGTIVVDTGDDTLRIEMISHPTRVQELLSARLGRRAWTGDQPPPMRR